MENKYNTVQYSTIQYNRVWHEGLIDKIRSTGISVHLYNLSGGFQRVQRILNCQASSYGDQY